MTGSIRLHWKERLPLDDIEHINEIIEEWELECRTLNEDDLHDMLMDTELSHDEVDEILKGSIYYVDMWCG